MYLSGQEWHSALKFHSITLYCICGVELGKLIGCCCESVNIFHRTSMEMFLLYILHVKQGYRPASLISRSLARADRTLHDFPRITQVHQIPISPVRTKISIHSVCVYDFSINDFEHKQKNRKCGGNIIWADTSSEDCMFCTKKTVGIVKKGYYYTQHHLFLFLKSSLYDKNFLLPHKYMEDKLNYWGLIDRNIFKLKTPKHVENDKPLFFPGDFNAHVGSDTIRRVSQGSHNYISLYTR